MECPVLQCMQYGAHAMAINRNEPCQAALVTQKLLPCRTSKLTSYVRPRESRTVVNRRLFMICMHRSHVHRQQHAVFQCGAHTFT